jgi:hypothetical protein
MRRPRGRDDEAPYGLGASQGTLERLRSCMGWGGCRSDPVPLATARRASEPDQSVRGLERSRPGFEGSCSPAPRRPWQPIADASWVSRRSFDHSTFCPSTSPHAPPEALSRCGSRASSACRRCPRTSTLAGPWARAARGLPRRRPGLPPRGSFRTSPPIRRWRHPWTASFRSRAPGGEIDAAAMREASRARHRWRNPRPQLPRIVRP